MRSRPKHSSSTQHNSTQRTCTPAPSHSSVTHSSVEHSSVSQSNVSHSGESHSSAHCLEARWQDNQPTKPKKNAVSQRALSIPIHRLLLWRWVARHLHSSQPTDTQHLSGVAEAPGARITNRCFFFVERRKARLQIIFCTSTQLLCARPQFLSTVHSLLHKKKVHPSTSQTAGRTTQSHTRSIALIKWIQSARSVKTGASSRASAQQYRQTTE